MGIAYRWFNVFATSRVLSTAETTQCGWLLATKHQVLGGNDTEVLHEISLFDCKSVATPCKSIVNYSTLKLSHKNILVGDLSSVDLVKNIANDFS